MVYDNGYISDAELYHHGVKGMHWGVRRYQNSDGTMTSAGKHRYNKGGNSADNKTDGKTKNSSEELSKQKRMKALKIGAAVAGTALATYGGYKLYKSGKLDPAIKKVSDKGKQVYDNFLDNHAYGRKMEQYMDSEAYSYRTMADEIHDRAEYYNPTDWDPDNRKAHRFSSDMRKMNDYKNAAEDIDYAKSWIPRNALTKKQFNKEYTKTFNNVIDSLDEGVSNAQKHGKMGDSYIRKGQAMRDVFEKMEDNSNPINEGRRKTRKRRR